MKFSNNTFPLTPINNCRNELVAPLPANPTVQFSTVSNVICTKPTYYIYTSHLQCFIFVDVP